MPRSAFMSLTEGVGFLTSGGDQVRFKMELREKNDFYETPPIAVRLLLENEHFEGRTWEPACGAGAISRVLIEAGLDVTSSDLIDRGYGTVHDFLSADLDPADAPVNIITNPPYRQAEKFVRHSLKNCTGKVAMLLRLSFLEGQKRNALFKETPLSKVLVFSRRIAPARGGISEELDGFGGMVAYAWFIWAHGHEGPPVLGWLK